MRDAMETRAAAADHVLSQLNRAEFREFLVSSLLELCSIDSTPERDVANLRKRERAAFDAIRSIAGDNLSRGEWREVPIDHEVLSAEESYTAPYYTDSVSPYADRSNLILILPAENESASGASIAVNAHIDTVQPYVAPERRGGRVFGRGSCDDKGNVTVMLGAIRLLGEIKRRFGIAPAKDLLFMFAIDEESGGNGSLALALDGNLKQRYDELVVLECCENTVYCANRGALWYRIELPVDRIKAPVKVAAELVLALEAAGRAIKQESDHPLFIDRPVQTCHGIWGPWGEHPSRVCGYLELAAKTGLSEAAVKEAINGGLQRYTSLYGDKTQTTRNGTAVVPWHYRLEQEASRCLVKIMGSTGHMAAVAQNDGALTKAAFLIEALAVADPQAEIELVGYDPRRPFVMEGGQSFVPTHSLQQIKLRIRDACRKVLSRFGFSDTEVEGMVTMNKLHNSAFCSDPESGLFLNARTISAGLGLPQGAVPQGWGASCDARLFAERYPQMPVITMGAGDLNNAHSDNESIDIDDLTRNAGLLTLLLLERSGAFKAA